MINLEIDGKPVQVDNGATVMDAANKMGLFVPHFCYHKKLSIAANCRMCLVQVEKAPKPLPACATPATEGMKVQTTSEYAKKAQEGVMEFLLINHPLDCPICDQGGECQLQDLAVGYGGSASRYQEEKRVVVNKNLGPLISTDMTRCIHCTRCVRFGQEIAGVMELGQAGRGEHSEILAFVGKTVDSEMSGNMIDLCPVGALTSKPFRYSARSWELSRRKSVSPHDALGANLIVQVKQERVMRVLPLENEAVNECWISDKDRFSYEGLNSPDRLTTPRVKRAGVWVDATWQEALQAVVDGLGSAREKHGADALGVLASPHSTLEELHLLNRLTRGLGSNNIDTRLRQANTGLDGKHAGARWLGMKIADLSTREAVLVIGSNLRKESPLIASRLRQIAKKGREINVVNAMADDWLMKVANKIVARPSAQSLVLAGISKALAELKGIALAPEIASVVTGASVTDEARKIAASLAGKEKTAVLLGNLALNSAHYASLHLLAQEIARLSSAAFGFIGEAANSVGAAVVGAEPGATGMCAQGMVAKPRKAYVLFGVEPDYDFHDAAATRAALGEAEFVVAMSAFQGNLGEHAHVLLPITPFSETAGTFVNIEGTVQHFNGVVKPLGEARPGWKVARVLGNLLGLDGFEQDNVEAIRKEIAADLPAHVAAKLNNAVVGATLKMPEVESGMERIADTPIYATDALVRRAPSLQKSADAKNARIAYLARDVFDKLGLGQGSEIKISQGGGVATLAVACDDTLAAGCVRVATGIAETSALGRGAIAIEKSALARAAE